MSPTTVVIDGLPVVFPFEPYEAQVDFMQSVLQCLNTSSHGLLESPTGTGKTLCLLCSTLAWMSQRKSCVFSAARRQGGESTNPLHKVVYCSRTHAQLTQVVRELKRTEYAAQFTMVLLGSREHMCVNSEVTRLTSLSAQRAMCSALRAERNCRFFRSLQSSTMKSAFLSEEHRVHDMEDLVTDGRKNGFCPYYHERDAAKLAEVVFMPYNYILDPLLRKQLPFDLKDCILIVDEAHNLPSALSSSGCVSLQPLDLTTALHDCSRAIAMQRLMAKGKANTDADDMAAQEQELASLKILLGRLEACIAAEPMTAEKSSSGYQQQQQQTSVKGELVHHGSYIFDFLEKALVSREVFVGGLHGAVSAGLNDVMSRCITLLSDSERPASGVERVQEFLTSVFAAEMASLDSTRFVLQESISANKPVRTLGFWSLDNTFLLAEIAGPLRTMLLTSGTLSPMEQFAAELGMAFPVQLRGSHVIKSDQVLGSILCRGPGGEKLNGGYAFRSSVDYRIGLGMSLVNIARNTPGGTLVFFPSYVAMNSAVELWRAGTGRATETKTVWGLLSELKPIFVEPTDASELVTIVQGYQNEVNASPLRGAMLLAVCRGKVSEGIDFADQHGRCVVVTGIPYANHTDLYVRLKRDYITSIASQRPLVDGRPFTGDAWYRNEAMRAVNQCIGRVIRHKDDFGVVVLADERFEGLRSSVSAWVREGMEVHLNFRGAYGALSTFFARRRPLLMKAETPLITVNDSASVSCAVEPDSAFLAKSYAAAEKRRHAEDEERLQRRRLESARETPTSLTPSGRTPAIELASSATATTVHSAAPIAIWKSFVQTKMTRQVLPSRGETMLAPSNSWQRIGSTSADFCAFLKSRLSEASYNHFRQTLAHLASLRSKLRIASGPVKEQLCLVMRDLEEVFREAAPQHTRAVFEEFGRHIPEEFRPEYADLLREQYPTAL